MTIFPSQTFCQTHVMSAQPLFLAQTVAHWIVKYEKGSLFARISLVVFSVLGTLASIVSILGIPFLAQVRRQYLDEKKYLAVLKKNT